MCCCYCGQVAADVIVVVIEVAFVEVVVANFGVVYVVNAAVVNFASVIGALAPTIAVILLQKMIWVADVVVVYVVATPVVVAEYFVVVAAALLQR